MGVSQQPASPPADPQDQELVRRVLSGDRDAFRLVVLRYQGLVANVVYRQSGGPDAVEDLVQETFLRAYRALANYDPSYRLSTWLARIALNAARDQGRKHKVRAATSPAWLASPVESESPLEVAARSEAHLRVTEALAELPDRQREVVVLSVYNGFSQSQIARALQLPLGTVKTRQRAAFKQLRQLVAPLRPGGAP